MRRVVLVDYGKQSGKLDPKYYPFIWLALIFATLFGNVYSLYSGYEGTTLRGATLLLDIIIDVLISGVLPVAICYLIASSVYKSLYLKRRLGAVPRKDFIYVTMLFIAGARMFMGIIRVFAFLEPDIVLTTTYWLDMLVYFVALYLEFFLVLVPKYIHDPVRTRSHFKFLSRDYVIAFGIITALFLLFVLIAIEGFETMLRDGTTSSTVEGGSGVTYNFTIDGEELTAADVRAMLLLFKGPLSILAYVSVGIYAGMLITHVVLSVLLKKKVDAFLTEHPAPYRRGASPHTGDVFDGFHRGNHPFEDSDGDNPYVRNANPFADDNPFSDDFGAKSDNPFSDDFRASDGSDKPKDDNPFDEF